MNNRKVEKEKLYCCFVWPLSFNLSGLGGPNRSIKTPASIAIRVIEVRNPPHHGKVTAHGEVCVNYAGMYIMTTKRETVFVSFLF